MPLLYEPNYLEQQDLYIRKIAFVREAASEFVTLFGAYRPAHHSKLSAREFGCDFAILTDLLLLGKKPGDKVIQYIADILGDESIEPEVPVFLNVARLLGKPLKIKNVRLTLYNPWVQTEDGGWEEEASDFFLIDHFTPLSPKERKQLRLEEKQKQLLQSLGSAYKQYKSLRGADFSKAAARKQAGLTDAKMFRLAKTCYNIDSGGKKL